MSEQILADTHAVLWYFKGAGNVEAPTTRRLERALSEGTLFCSTVSLREVAGLAQRGRVTFVGDVTRWARRAAALGLLWLPLDDEAAIESARLPGTPPKDPNDQMIIATARVHDLTLATRDGPILDYARGGHLRVMAV